MDIKSYIKRAIRYVVYGQPNIIVTPHIQILEKNQYLKERTALITGGSSGIGIEIARAYLDAGAKVIIAGRTQDKLEIAKALLEKSYTNSVEYITIDITKCESFPSKIKEAVSKFGKIDILVNNAGTSGGLIINATPEEYDKVMDTNLKGVFFLSQTVGRYMKENNIHGNILNVSSASSVRPAACAYTISKWGVRGFTQGLARTLLPYDIIVNAIAPGPTATPLLHKDSKDTDIALPITPSGRYALPEEVANMAVIMVSNMGRLIVGDTVFMTGGAGNIINGDQSYPF